MPARGIKLPKLSFGTVRDIIYVITILAGLFYHFRDKSVNQAIFNEQVKTMQENQQEILKKLQDNDLRWDDQLEQNGKINMYILIDSRQ